MARFGWLHGIAIAACATSACDDGIGGYRSSGGGGGGGGSNCYATADNCAGEQICVSGYCEAAFPRVYVAEIDEVSFKVTKPNSQDCWDAPCAAPDPYVVVRVDGREVGRTAAASDSYISSWPNRFELQLIAGSRLEFVVYDEDLADDDLALTCSANPIEPRLLRSRALGCGNRDVATSISVSVEPKL